MRSRKRLIGLLLAGLITALMPVAATGAVAQTEPQYRVLVFAKTEDVSKNQATLAGIDAIRQLGAKKGFRVEATRDTTEFRNANRLKRFGTIVFLNTTGDVLNATEQANFEGYIRQGGGFLGIGSAIETEPDWEFYGDLLGTRAASLTEVQSGTIKVADRGHDASKDLPEYWDHTDAWYNYTSNVRGQSHVLATVVEGVDALGAFEIQPWGGRLDGISGGTMGFDHPVTWCKEYQGGRSFYTGLGNTAASYGSAELRSHLAGAISWSAGFSDPVYSDCGATILANYQQTRITSQPNLNEPIGFDVLPDGRVIQTDRRGSVRLHDATTNESVVIANLEVYTHSEDGLYGPGIDNNFAENKWVYLLYPPLTVKDVKLSTGEIVTQTTPTGAAPNTAADITAWDPWIGYFQLSRFKFVDGPTPSLDLESEEELMRVPVNRGACCHVGGDIDFDDDNNLWLVMGDDTPAGGGNSGGFGPFNDMRSNENQTIAVGGGATGGTFTLTFDGQTTAPIAFPLDNAAIEAALEALSNIDDVAVTGTGTRTVNFRGNNSQTDVPQMTGDGSGLTPEGATLTLGTSAAGGLYQAPHVDARRGSLNTNDLRGKIIRITPKEGAISPAEENTLGGAYGVPAGNLYPVGTANTRPEVYAMGFRNPFRIQVDSNDVAYITDYSPDSGTPTQYRGPAGTGRVMVVREPSNYGWPLCYKTDLPYYRWDFNLSTPLDNPPQVHDCDDPDRGPQNNSRWNLNGGPSVEPGLEYGPPITDPEIWYSFAAENNAANPRGTPCFAYYGPEAPANPNCPRLFPEFGTGGVGPHGADVYEYDPANPNPTKFPPYYDGAIFFGEFTRDMLREIRLDSQDRVFKINDLLTCGGVGTAAAAIAGFDCDNPMDMQFGDDGHFYLLTYGDGFFAINNDAGMYRWEYVKGQRAPRAEMSATPTNGQNPLTVQFSSEGSSDPDPGDIITFAWDFDGNGTTDSTAPNPTYTYTVRGQYTARLTVTDNNGLSSQVNTTITVGNTAPTVVVNTPVEGGLFSFGETIPYTVTVTDPEDGPIDCSRVAVTFVLAHDSHGHAQDTFTGCSGTFQTQADDVSHGGNVWGVISASYTDNPQPGGVPALTTVTQQNVRQKVQQLEHALEQFGTTVASTNDEGGGLHRAGIGNGDWIKFNGPLNLVNINSIVFRTAGNTGTIDLRRDSPTGTVVGSYVIPSTGSTNTWASHSFALTDPGGTSDYYLTFRPATGSPGNNYFNLNWVQFIGQGIAGS